MIKLFLLNKYLNLSLLLPICFFPSITFTDVSWDQLNLQYDRCTNRMEQVEQHFNRFIYAVSMVKNLLAFAHKEDEESIKKFLDFAENMQIYIRNRIERVKNQSDKLNNDISSGQRKGFLP